MEYLLYSFYKISFLCLMMFILSYICGLVPLIIKFSELRLLQLTIIGAGTLIGTSFAIIIPEGIEAINGLNNNLHQVIGPSLVFGFVFMLLFDFLAKKVSQNKRQKITTTMGLIVHSAADGLALGAVASTGKVEVEIIVFLALLLHKGPAAFTLTTFLIQSGLNRVNIRKHLLAFTLSTPISALLTFLSLLIFSYSSIDLDKSSQSNFLSLRNGTNMPEISNHTSSINKDSNSSFYTAVAMLFSGTTFLYVATFHVLPETGLLSFEHHHYPSVISSDSTKVDNSLTHHRFNSDSKLLSLGSKTTIMENKDAATLQNNSKVMEEYNDSLDRLHEEEGIQLIQYSPTKISTFRETSPKLSSLSDLQRYGLFLCGIIFPLFISLTIQHSH